jgi:hypothetical protein
MSEPLFCLCPRSDLRQPLRGTLLRAPSSVCGFLQSSERAWRCGLEAAGGTNPSETKRQPYAGLANHCDPTCNYLQSYRVLGLGPKLGQTLLSPPTAHSDPLHAGREKLSMHILQTAVAFFYSFPAVAENGPLRGRCSGHRPNYARLCVLLHGKQAADVPNQTLRSG